jgi:hypothetical protein
LTRKTGADGADVGACAECYELGGIENEISDYGDPDGKLAAECVALREKIRALGGTPWADEKPEGGAS